MALKIAPNNMKHFNLNLDEESINDVAEIQAKRRIKSWTETIRYCIAETHKKEVPNSVLIEKSRAVRANRSAEEIAEERLKVEQATLKKKEALVRQANIDICLSMDEAVLSTDPERGYETCYYPEFECNGPHRTSKTWKHVALIDLNAETPSLQYSDLFNKTGAEGKANWLKQKAQNDKDEAKRLADKTPTK